VRAGLVIAGDEQADAEGTLAGNLRVALVF
jgi:hypothetical protein